MFRNLRYSIRVLARSPGFTLTVVITLAVAIGANSAVFSALDTVLLQPLPFADADRLMHVSHAQETTSVEVAIPPVRLLDWTERSSTFEAIAAYYTEDVTDTTGDRPENVRRATITPGFFDLWRVAPATGRLFTDDEHRFGARPTAVVSDEYWRNRLNADPNILDTIVVIDGKSVSIVGVMPPAFARVDRLVDVWMPHPVNAPWAVARQFGWFNGVTGRLKPGVTLDQARADLNRVQSELGGEYPETDDDLAVRAVPHKSTVVGGLNGSLWLLFGAVSALLLIACTNIAALLLARATQRERAVAIRYSLGASRTKVALQLLTETAVLVLAGAGAGLLVAFGIVTAMTRFAGDLPRFDEIAIDERTVLYTIAATVIVALLCGIFPALKNTRDPSSSAAATRTLVSSRHSSNWVLVGVQVALSVTLLAGAGLLLRSFDALTRIDPGFDATRVLTFRISGSFAENTVAGAVLQRIDRTLDELTSLAGIEAAGTSFALPGVPGDRAQQELQLVEAQFAPESRLIAESRTVSQSYFETLQIPLLAGELCRQPEGGAAQVVVNRSFAERYFPQRSAIGLHIDGSSPSRIVGIVGDARELGTNRDPVPMVYNCYSAPSPFPWFFVRTAGDPMAVAETVRSRLNELEPLRSVYDIAPLDRRIGDVFSDNRLRTLLLTLFAAASLTLTCSACMGR